MTEATSTSNGEQPGMPPDTVTMEGHDIFPFFDLPREMRDMIYDLARADLKVVDLPETRDDPQGKYLRAYTRDGPYIHLLLVSKQFRKEYGDMVKKEDTTLVFEDRHEVRDRTGSPPYGDIYANDWEPAKPVLPVLPDDLQHITKVDFLLQMRFYTNMADLEHCRHLIAGAAEKWQSAGKTFTVKLYVEDNDIDLDGYYYWPEADGWDWLAGYMQAFVEMEIVTRFELMWYHHDDLYTSHGVLDQDTKCLETWTMEEDWKVVNPHVDDWEAAVARSAEIRRKVIEEMESVPFPWSSSEADET